MDALMEAEFVVAMAAFDIAIETVHSLLGELPTS